MNASLKTYDKNLQKTGRREEEYKRSLFACGTLRKTFSFLPGSFLRPYNKQSHRLPQVVFFEDPTQIHQIAGSLLDIYHLYS